MVLAKVGGASAPPFLLRQNMLKYKKIIHECEVEKMRLLDVFLEQKNNSIEGQVYHKTQIDMAYNSNHIEGSRLSHFETRFIFETRQVPSDVDNKPLYVDDVIETVNHFQLFNYMLDTADDQLSEELIKKYHEILKNGTKDALKGWKIGDYKKIENEVGNIITSSIENVQGDMEALLVGYAAKEKRTIEDIADFHWRFETIHPFQDGNGRIGRMIVFKECLKNNLVPALILDKNKQRYYESLAAAPNMEPLRTFFKDSQVEYLKDCIRLIADFNIEFSETSKGPPLIRKCEGEAPRESSYDAAMDKIL